LGASAEPTAASRERERARHQCQVVAIRRRRRAGYAEFMAERNPLASFLTAVKKKHRKVGSVLAMEALEISASGQRCVQSLPLKAAFASLMGEQEPKLGVSTLMDVRRTPRRAVSASLTAGSRIHASFPCQADATNGQ